MSIPAIGYFTLLGLLACYGLYRYYLLGFYFRFRSRAPQPAALLQRWPTVTVQVPVYNERYVVERALRCACEMDYPRQLLEIQVLDDSTDDTPGIIARIVAEFRRQGLSIHHLRRSDRRHFKAGALAEGLRQTRSELVAVFDADFAAPRDFLRRTVPFFSDPAIGMVQARWGHLNAPYSLLTQSQAMLLDGHFGIEQLVRHRAGRFFNFNGTAGIWRKAAIESSGGWQPDTLTEDLDLSYRAQLAGWRGVYLSDLAVPAEVPVEMNAFKNQQYRWAKGSIQTAKKLLPTVLRSRLPVSTKVEAVFHLLGFLTYPVGMLACLGVPAILTGAFHLPHSWVADAFWFALLAIPGGCFYLCAQRELYPDWRKRLVLIPWVIAVGVGLSFSISVAVLDGLFGRHSEFIRTTKFGIQAKADRWRRKIYRTHLTPTAWVELALAFYFAWGCLAAYHRGLFLALPSVGLFCAGFAYVGGLSVWQQTRLQAWFQALAAYRGRILRELEA